MQVNEISVLGNINVVAVSLKFFGGSASLTAEDLGIDTSALPADVIALGSKKIVDKDLLKGFQAARKNMQRKGLLKGTAFLGGYAMSPENSKEYLMEVQSQLAELQTDMESFLESYPSYVDAWASLHPAFAEAIRAAAPSVQAVRSRFQFKVRCFKVSQPGDELADGGMIEEVNGLAGQILEEISRDVKLTWKDRGYGAQQIKSLLRRVSDKASSLSFINGDLNKITLLINDVISSLPPTGKIEGTDYLSLKGLMDMLMEPAKLLASLKQGDLALVPADAVIADAPADAVTADESQTPFPVLDFESITENVTVPETISSPAQAVEVPSLPAKPSVPSWAW